MSILFHYPCRKCGKYSDLSFDSVCQNRSTKTGEVCGERLPQALSEFNSMMTGKIVKHTQEPTNFFSGLVSYSPDTGIYLQNRVNSAESGNIYLDVKEGFFCTYLTPSGDAAIATVCSGSNMNRFSVSGFKMPLNSKAHELHGRYANLDPAMLFVCTPEEVVVEYPSSSHPNEFRVLKGGQPLAAWNTVALSGFIGSHVIVK